MSIIHEIGYLINSVTRAASRYEDDKVDRQRRLMWAQNFTGVDPKDISNPTSPVNVSINIPKTTTSMLHTAAQISAIAALCIKIKENDNSNSEVYDVVKAVAIALNCSALIDTIYRVVKGRIDSNKYAVESAATQEDSQSNATKSNNEKEV